MLYRFYFTQRCVSGIGALQNEDIIHYRTNIRRKTEIWSSKTTSKKLYPLKSTFVNWSVFNKTLGALEIVQDELHGSQVGQWKYLLLTRYSIQFK